MIALFGMSGTMEWVVILVIVLIFFGVGKLPAVLGQMGKGVKAFKDGMDPNDAKEIDVKADDIKDSVSEPARKKVADADELR